MIYGCAMKIGGGVIRAAKFSLVFSDSLLAYYKAQNRGFEAGHELDDWLDAERDLLF